MCHGSSATKLAIIAFSYSTVQTRVGSVTHIAGDKATHKTTHMAENVAESEGRKIGKGNRSGRRGNIVCLFPDSIKSSPGSKGPGAWELG